MEHATTVPAGIWSVRSRVTHLSRRPESTRGRGHEGKTKKNDACVARLPGNDESSKNNRISDEEEERRVKRDDLFG